MSVTNARRYVWVATRPAYGRRCDLGPSRVRAYTVYSTQPSPGRLHVWRRWVNRPLSGRHMCCSAVRLGCDGCRRCTRPSFCAGCRSAAECARGNVAGVALSAVPCGAVPYRAVRPSSAPRRRRKVRPFGCRTEPRQSRPSRGRLLGVIDDAPQQAGRRSSGRVAESRGGRPAGGEAAPRGDPAGRVSPRRRTWPAAAHGPPRAPLCVRDAGASER